MQKGFCETLAVITAAIILLSVLPADGSTIGMESEADFAPQHHADMNPLEDSDEDDDSDIGDLLILANDDALAYNLGYDPVFLGFTQNTKPYRR